ncbi:MAG: bifunctional oligoribonuclease/PAP phosphatase NrnA [Candidatus Omnitrophica bacterium]|nr:bifunctional oligoribonuclease/PAP phosphatase NrnA [Candidatus Omnitrophota bacterium]
MSLKKAIEFIKKRNNFLITSHTNMEGDALGSELAFYRLVKKLGKNACVVNDDVVPYGYEFLPETGVIKRYKGGKSNVKFDAVTVLDCSDLKRTGEVYTLNKENKPVLNIDHHISNVKFGETNWIEPYAASCTQMIYKLYRKMKVPLDRDTALLLYVGIVTDTGSFRYSNTTPETHKAAAELLKFGLEPPKIYKNIHENIPYEDMKFLSSILPHMKRSAGGRIAWFELRKEIFRGHKKLSFDLSEEILAFARSIKGVEVAILFKENLKTANEVRVNLRSQGKVDVNEVARACGGGGHKTASGCTVLGRMEEVRDRVLRKIKTAFKAEK